jgi:hypothetical protein
MSKKFLQANYKNKTRAVKVGVNLLLWEEDGIYYQYSPELDLTGYGKSEIEAVNSFEYVLYDFISYTLNKGIIFVELERLGWTTRS